MNHLSLFTGYGGFELGLQLAGIDFRTIGYVEIEPYCQRIIAARIEDGLLDRAPIVRDIRACDFRPMAGLVDIVTAGFPCQPHSVAGLRKQEADGRDLWPDTLRAIGEVRPRYALLENVPGILAHGFAGTVIGDMAEIGYDCQWGIVSAGECGAPHERKRWWCLAADADGQRQQQSQGSEREERRRAGDCIEGLAYASSKQNGASGLSREDTEGMGWWAAEPGLVRMVHGYPGRVDRIKALGNGIVPVVVAEFLRRLEKGVAR